MLGFYNYTVVLTYLGFISGVVGIFLSLSQGNSLAGVVIGSIVYRIIIAFVLRISLTADTVIKITADDMKLITAIIVVIALVAPGLKDSALTKLSGKEGE